MMITIASIFACAFTSARYLYGSPGENLTQVNGFQTYIESSNHQGDISITRDSVKLEARNNTFPKAFVYAAAEDFVWKFSAHPLTASGSCYPIFFSIEWAQTSISVWAEIEKGWYYSSNINRSLELDTRLIGGFTALGSKYDIEIKWDEQVGQTIATVSLRNATWVRKLIFRISQIGIAPSLTLQAWADYDAHVSVHYGQSVFLSSNSRFMKESYTATVASVLTSIVFMTITISVLLFRSRAFSSFLELSSGERLPKLGSTFKRMNRILERIYIFLSSYAKENMAFIYLFSFFAILRIVLAISLPAHWFDMYAFKAWYQIINDKGLLNIYTETVVLPPILGIRPVYPYPPIIAYAFFSVSRVFPVGDRTIEAVPFLLKLPPILAELALGWVAFTAVKRWRGYRAGLAAATLSMLNVVNSSIWGQYESVMALFMVLAVWLILTKNIESGWLLAALATATKSTALPLIPGLLIASLKRGGLLRSLLGVGTFCLTTVAVWAPFLLSGYSLNFALWQFGFGLFSSHGAFTPASSEITKTTVLALNVWPIINLLIDRVSPGTSVLATVPDNKPNQFLFLSYYQLGFLLFAAFYAAILYKISRDASDQGLMEMFSLLMFVFYMFPTRMHERYLYPALSFLPLAYGKAKSVKVFYILLLTTFSISLFCGLSAQWTPPDVVNVFGQWPYVGDFGILSLTLVNISVLALMLRQLIRGQG